LDILIETSQDRMRLSLKSSVPDSARKLELDIERQQQDALTAEKVHTHKRFPLQRLLQRQSELIHRSLIPQGDILEIGCGIGDFLEYCKRSFPDRMCVGLELSNSAVAAANRRLAKIEGNNVVAVVGDAEDLEQIIVDLKDFNQLTNVVMRGVVHHLQRPKKVFQKIFNILPPGGKLIILEGNASSIYRKVTLGFAYLIGVQHESSPYPHIPPKDIAFLLEDIGFSKTDIGYVAGVFTPMAYLGLGGAFFWKMAVWIDSLAVKVAPNFFGWWFLLQAEKASH
jgi:SAM-dependent methyltransferase